MNESREIVFRPTEGCDIRAEFDRFLATAHEEGWDKLKVLFGFAWGNYAYEGDWIEEVISPGELQARVRGLEDHQDGAIGSDDLFVTVLTTAVRHTFCHENDIHLEGRIDDRYVAAEAARYRSLGWERFERARNSGQDGEAERD
jgi:hypothetical protein